MTATLEQAEQLNLSLNPDYTSWIERHVRRRGVDRLDGTCQEMSEVMKREFPELTVVRGHVFIIGPHGTNHRTGHWWLTDPEGCVVDPTALQFCEILEYDPWDEAQDEPTGKCPNCGGYCFNGASLCTPKCEQEYIAYLNQS